MSLDKEIRAKTGRRPEPEISRFARLISPEPNTGCWLWSVPPVVNANRKPEQKNQYQDALSCINGHSFSGANLRFGKDGRRVCRACANERNRRWKAERCNA